MLQAVTSNRDDAGPPSGAGGAVVRRMPCKEKDGAPSRADWTASMTSHSIPGRRDHGRRDHSGPAVSALEPAEHRTSERWPPGRQD